MKLTKISVDTQRVQDVLFSHGTTFEHPVNLEKFAIEILSCCKTVEIQNDSNLQKSATFEVSFSDGN